MNAAEAILRRDRTVVLAGLATLTLMAWAWILAGAGMGLTAVEMSAAALFPHLGASGGVAMGDPGGALGRTPLMVMMWWVMMIAMMLPSAAPVVLLHARTVRHGQRKGRLPPGPVPSAWFIGGYLLVWLGFSVAAAALQWALVATDLLSDMMLRSDSRWLSAAVLALAALYQLSPLKNACLAQCRAPADFLSAHWRPGRAGALAMGLEHGAFCVGCCWALMALLFVGGVMNLVWIAALAILVLAEKLAPAGPSIGRLAATVLLAWAIATLAI